ERKNLKCPVCGNITAIKELKRQFLKKEVKKRIIAVVNDGVNTKEYRLPYDFEIDAVSQVPKPEEKPIEKMPTGNNRDLHCTGWGVEYWSDMFTDRQLLLLNTLTRSLRSFKKSKIFHFDGNYKSALVVYLSIFIDRVAAINTAFGRLHVSRETL